MRLVLLGIACAGALAAQSWYPRHNFTFGLGAANPQAELSGLFEQRPGISIAYGYRFQRFFQADGGLDTVFGAAGVRDYLQTILGYQRIRDYQFFIPLGGRAILPLARERVLFYGGGGGAYMRYTELLHQPSDYYRVDCPVCTARSGWGYYSTIGANFFLDSGRHFRFGIGAKQYRGHTDGDELGFVPAVRTKDKWTNILGEFGFSF